MRVMISMRDELHKELKNRWYNVSKIIDIALINFLSQQESNITLLEEKQSITLSEESKTDTKPQTTTTKKDVTTKKDTTTQELWYFDEPIWEDEYNYYLEEAWLRIFEPEKEMPMFKEFFMTLTKWEFNTLIDIYEEQDNIAKSKWLPSYAIFTYARENNNQKRFHKNESHINWILYHLKEYELSEDMRNKLKAHSPVDYSIMKNEKQYADQIL